MNNPDDPLDFFKLEVTSQEPEVDSCETVRNLLKQLRSGEDESLQYRIAIHLDTCDCLELTSQDQFLITPANLPHAYPAQVKGYLDFINKYHPKEDVIYYPGSGCDVSPSGAFHGEVLYLDPDLGSVKCLRNQGYTAHAGTVQDFDPGMVDIIILENPHFSPHAVDKFLAPGGYLLCNDYYGVGGVASRITGKRPPYISPEKWDSPSPIADLRLIDVIQRPGHGFGEMDNLFVFQKTTTKRNPGYRRNIDEDIRTLERRATQSGAYDDIIKYLAARRRRGDDVEHEYMARTAFHAIVQASNQTGLPEHYKKDLQVLIPDFLARNAPPRFGLVLRESGAHLMTPLATDFREELRSISRHFTPEKHYYHWNGKVLQEMGLEGLIQQMEVDTKDPEFLAWAAAHFPGGPINPLHPRILYPGTRSYEVVKDYIARLIEEYSSRPDRETHLLHSDAECAEFEQRLREHYENKVLTGNKMIRRELQLQEGFPVLGTTSAGYADDTLMPMFSSDDPPVRGLL